MRKLTWLLLVLMVGCTVVTPTPIKPTLAPATKMPKTPTPTETPAPTATPIPIDPTQHVPFPASCYQGCDVFTDKEGGEVFATLVKDTPTRVYWIEFTDETVDPDTGDPLLMCAINETRNRWVLCSDLEVVQ